MDDQRFDKLAADELAALEDRLQELDPDDVEIDVSTGVLSLTLRDATRVVINSHRAARQIWMAALRQAWHFDWDEPSGRWRTGKSEDLRETLARILGERLHQSVPL